MNKWEKLPIGEIFSIEKGSLQSTKCTPGKFTFITASSEWKTHNEYSHDCEALVYAVAASGSLGRCHHYDGKFISSDLCFILRAKDEIKRPINYRFYQNLFKFLRNDIVSKTKAGTSKEAISKKRLSSYYLPYIDINHQEYWETKLNNLNSTCENLETKLIEQSSYLTKLRQAILQEAIEGKLTTDWRKEQEEALAKDAENAKVSLGELRALREKDPDYNAEALLEKIKAEKESLAKDAKRAKKEKQLPPIKPEEVPFELPEGWVWCRLGEICDSIKYGTSEKCSYENTKNAKVLRIPNVSSGIINDDDLKYTQLSQKDLQELSLKQGDILTIRSNGSPEIVGTMALVTDVFENYCYAGYLIRLRFMESSLGEFISKISRAKYIRCQIEDPLRTTVGINNINSQELSNLYIPLPPINEQNEIIEHIEKIFLTVDELEKQVSERKEQSEQLMQVVLREAFEGNKEVVEAPINLGEPEKIRKITPFQQMQLIAAVIGILEKNNQHQGEMIIAKYLYILSYVSRIQTGFQFKKWHFGPYDPEIKKRISNRTYFTKHGKKGYETYSILKKETLFKYHNPVLDEAVKGLSSIVKIFTNTKNVEKRDHKIELLATVLKTMEDSGKTLSKDVYYEMSKWQTNPELTGFSSKAEKFSEQEVMDCINFVKKEGWI